MDVDTSDKFGGERDGWIKLKELWAAKELILVGGQS